MKKEQFEYKNSAIYPENYQTCRNISFFLFEIMRILWWKKNKQDDIEKKQPVESKKNSSNKSNVEDSKESISESTKGQVLNKYRVKQGHELVPENYHTCFHGLQLLSKTLMVILGLGSSEIVKIRDKKEKHKWSIQIMGKLLENARTYQYENNGRNPRYTATDETTPYAFFDGGGVGFNSETLNEPWQNYSKESEKKETPILVAAKNGVMELVEMILQLFPVAIHDVDPQGKNVVLLAVDNRQPHVYQFLLEHPMKEMIFRRTDKEGNSALHLAAKVGDRKPWRIPGAALQMQWEIKWYKFVKGSMAPQFFTRYNTKGKTAHDVFSEEHNHMVTEGCTWLRSTSESCSVVAALIATVAFATSATVPGGVKQDSGTPTLENESAFSIFAISSLVALCFSVTAVVMFLAILTSRYEAKDFYHDLPRKLILGMSSLFVSIASMLVSFCAGHFFVLKSKLQYAAFPVYLLTCFPVSLFAIAQFPLYFDLIKANFTKVPQRSYN